MFSMKKAFLAATLSALAVAAASASGSQAEPAGGAAASKAPVTLRMFAQGVTPGVDRGLATLPKLNEMARLATE